MTKTSVKDKSLVKSLFKGKFNLSEDDFNEGLANHDFFEVVGEDGRVKYSWTQGEHSHTKGASSRAGTEASKVLSKKEKNLQDAAFAMWGKGLFKPTGGSAKALSAPETQLALEDSQVELDEDQWNKAQHQLNMSISAFEKLEQQCKKCLQDVGVDAKEDELWKQLQLGCLKVTFAKEYKPRFEL